jgi:Asp-tRNA(Asn)/Glu-tRNA(Gln) amidotransferase B subunit
MMQIKEGNWSKDEIEFINRILLHEYLGLVNANVDLDSIDLRRRCEKILSYGELLKSKAISRRVKNTVFAKLFEPVNINKMARDLVKEMDLFLINDEKVINESILKLFEQNSAAINEYKSKEKKRVKIFDFFVGRVHKDLNERADPELVDKLVLDNLKKTIQS